MDRTITINDFPKISFFSEDDTFQTTFELKAENDGFYTYKFSITAAKEASPKPMTFRWRLPSFNMKGV